MKTIFFKIINYPIFIASLVLLTFIAAIIYWCPNSKIGDKIFWKWGWRAFEIRSTSKFPNDGVIQKEFCIDGELQSETRILDCLVALKGIKNPSAVRGLVEAARNFLLRIEELEPKMTSAFTYLHVHHYGWKAEDNFSKEQLILADALIEMDKEEANHNGDFAISSDKMWCGPCGMAFDKNDREGFDKHVCRESDYMKKEEA